MLISFSRPCNHCRHSSRKVAGGCTFDFSALNSPFEHSAERWGVHCPHRLFSANLFRTVAERVGRRLELAEPRTLQQRLASSPTGRRELLYVLNDGSMVPTQSGLWREAKVGVLVRGENYVSHREAGRARVLSARYVAVLGEQDEFKAAMRAARDAERWGRFIEVVWLGDARVDEARRRSGGPAPRRKR